MGQTIFFEDRFDCDISNFSSTEDVDRYIEEKSGSKMRVVKIPSNLIGQVGNVFPIYSKDRGEIEQSLLIEESKKLKQFLDSLEKRIQELRFTK